ncbi:MAG TPA: hypothetical protein VGX68_29255 [Thermoanaerobaculia bacterium]|jgi:hypothetical protein|nr:hypothetical protein [Thermoanaerobaculia bacterium]
MAQVLGPLMRNEADRASVQWQVIRGGAALHRQYQFPNATVAASFAQFAVALAACTRLPLFVRQADSQVFLALRTEGSRRLAPLTREMFDSIASLQ